MNELLNELEFIFEIGSKAWRSVRARTSIRETQLEHIFKNGSLNFIDFDGMGFVDGIQNVGCHGNSFVIWSKN